MRFGFSTLWKAPAGSRGLQTGVCGNQGWVRVRSGATLSKTGSNQINWNDVNVTNDGDIHVTGGTLQLEQNTTFRAPACSDWMPAEP